MDFVHLQCQSEYSVKNSLIRVSNLVDQVKEIALASMTSQKLQKQYLGDIPLEADCNVAETWGEAH